MPYSVSKKSVKEVRYLNKDFSSFKANLIEFAKVYFPNTYNDFNESSPGMMFIEMASYVGDVLSYYIDNQFKESLLASTSLSIAAAVNCLVTEPISKIPSLGIGAESSKLP